MDPSYLKLYQFIMTCLDLCLIFHPGAVYCMACVRSHLVAGNITHVDDIRNSVNLGFCQLIQGYKQTYRYSFTVCHQTQETGQRVWYIYSLPLICAISQTFNCKSYLYPEISWETPNITSLPSVVCVLLEKYEILCTKLLYHVM